LKLDDYGPKLSTGCIDQRSALGIDLVNPAQRKAQSVVFVQPLLDGFLVRLPSAAMSAAFLKHASPHSTSSDIAQAVCLCLPRAVLKQVIGCRVHNCTSLELPG
jgi:hypothetical protein